MYVGVNMIFCKILSSNYKLAKAIKYICTSASEPAMTCDNASPDWSLHSALRKGFVPKQ